jgi:repressor LexA
MSPTLTAAQHRIFLWIEDFIAQHNISPTYREIQKGLGYRSPATVQTHVEALIAKGMLGYISGKARSITILKPSRTVQLLGAIAANSLVETFPEQEIEYLNLANLPKFARLSSHELSQHFALRVRGDSMINALIDHNDVVVLRRESDHRAVRNGTIVAARVNGATTLKYFSRTGNLITLQPANPNYEPTLIDITKEEVNIQGIFAGLLRGVV